MWISIEDRLPKPGQEVLVYMPCMCSLTVYRGPAWDEPWDCLDWEDITHWMQIPDYPDAA